MRLLPPPLPPPPQPAGEADTRPRATFPGHVHPSGFLARSQGDDGRLRSLAVGPFVGREAELGSLEHLLAGGERLVTVLGPAGMGKTRLAVEVALRARSQGAFAVLFVDLTHAREAEGVCFALTVEMGARVEPEATSACASSVGTLLASLGRALVVLDGFEHLVRLGSTLLTELHAAAPEAHFLVTSRERLRLHAERVVDLGPLALPADSAAHEEAPAAAVALFVARAQLARPSYLPQPAETSSLIEIARRLEGIPLAIQLAAPWIAVMGTQDLARALELRFLALAADARDLPARHATLDGALEWSWDLLTGQERLVLARLSVFCGGFGLEAAVAVAGPVVDPDGTQPARLHATLAALRDKSLLTSTQPSRFPGEVRLSMYDHVREFLGRKLTANEGETARGAHARIFAGLAEELSANLDRDPETVNRLALEMENLVAANEHLLLLGTPEALDAALAITTSLDGLFEERGPPERRFLLLERAIQLGAPLAGSARFVAHALVRRARCRSDRSTRDQARRDLARAGELLAGIDDPHLEAQLELDRGILHVEEGHMDEGEARLTRAAELVRQASSDVLEGRVEFSLGKAAEYRGNRRKCLDHHLRAVAALERCQARRLLGLLHGAVADDRIALGARGWRADFEKGYALVTLFDNRRVQGQLHAVWASGCLDEERFDEAEEHLTRSLALLVPVGAKLSAALSGGMLGVVLLARGELTGALARFTDAVDEFRRLGQIHWLASYALILASTHAELGDVERARTQLAIVARLNARTNDRVHDAIRRLVEGHADIAEAHARAASGEVEQSEALFRAGAARIEAFERSAERGECEHGRFLLRFIKAAYARRQATPQREDVGGASGSEDESSAVWLVDPAGAAVVLPEGRTIDLARRHVLRRLLLALVRQWKDRPRELVTIEELIEAGWPGERLARSAAWNRLNASLVSLRKLGLGPVLQSRGGGYRLDPQAHFVVAAERLG